MTGPVRVDVHVDDRKAVAETEKLVRRLQDGRPALLGIVDLLLAAERERFSGTRWARVAPATLARDARAGRDPRLMVVTGALMRSLTERGAPDQILTVTPTTLRFGTRVWYAVFHQKGSAHPSRDRKHRATTTSDRRLPRRPLAGVTRAQHAQIVSKLSSLLFDA
jgi:phage gpG-like protein